MSLVIPGEASNCSFDIVLVTMHWKIGTSNRLRSSGAGMPSVSPIRKEEIFTNASTAGLPSFIMYFFSASPIEMDPSSRVLDMEYMRMTLSPLDSIARTISNSSRPPSVM